MSEAGEAFAGKRRGLLPRFTLKDGDNFLLADALGDVQGSDDGLFVSDTRILSRFELEVAGDPPRSSAPRCPRTTPYSPRISPTGRCRRWVSAPYRKV